MDMAGFLVISWALVTVAVIVFGAILLDHFLKVRRAIKVKSLIASSMPMYVETMKKIIDDVMESTMNKTIEMTKKMTQTNFEDDED